MSGTDASPGGLLRCAALGLALCAAQAAADEGATSRFRISLEEAGVYGLSHEALSRAGLDVPELDSARLACTHAGKPVPLWIADGGDGRFGPGDTLELVAEQRSGDASAVNHWAPLSVYVLRLDGDKDAARMGAPAAEERAAAEDPAAEAPAWSVERRYDPELLLHHPKLDPAVPPQGIWFWTRMTHVDEEPFRFTLDLRDAEPGLAEEFSLGLRWHGWSAPLRKPAPETPDHHVDVYVDRQKVGEAEWNGQAPFVFSGTGLPGPTGSAAGLHTLELKVPERSWPDGTGPLIDAVLLDWITVRYACRPVLGAEQVRLVPRGTVKQARLRSAPGRTLIVYTDRGDRIPARPLAGVDPAGRQEHVVSLPEAAGDVWVVPDGRLREPVSIERYQPASLLGSQGPADYLMIAHPELMAAVEPLAEAHRRRGLKVQVIDVQDLYDELSHGMADPRAIRGYLEARYHGAHRPRFALLVGDASTQGTGPGGRRNLIPAVNTTGARAPWVSDNWYAAFGGGDLYPDMALGRFPAADPQEAAAMAEKSIRFLDQAAAAAGRRSVLWVTSSEARFTGQADRLAKRADPAGFASAKLYSPEASADPQSHQAALRSGMAAGHDLVFFLGHGGRAMWRTAPPDLDRSKDLFVLEDLDRLEPAQRLPVVLSLSCATAPFNHPEADSLGERLLRMPGKGAVAVVAASGQNNPIWAFELGLVEAFTRPGTIGEALVAAKREIPETSVERRRLIEMYNLLGDPALPVPVPGPPSAAGGAGP